MLVHNDLVLNHLHIHVNGGYYLATNDNDSAMNHVATTYMIKSP
jgi:hypothetical protein